MKNKTDIEVISEGAEEYIRLVMGEFEDRWDKWPVDLSRREMHEVIGALLARQVTVVAQLATAPSLWNPHMAPVFLRMLTDGYITLAWIFQEPDDRAKKFILYGLGQEKLSMEHRKADLEAQGFNAEEDPVAKASEAWANSQQYTFLTEVQLGSWSGIDTRRMAQEAGCSDLYNLAFTPFSAAVHSTWQHIGRYNVLPCPNPLHGGHKIPRATAFSSIDPDYMFRAAKYVSKSFFLFDEKTGVKSSKPAALDAFVKTLDRLSEGNSQPEELPNE